MRSENMFWEMGAGVVLLVAFGFLGVGLGRMLPTLWVRVPVLFLYSYFGLSAVSVFSGGFGSFMNDGIAYDEGAPLPYEVKYDGTGNNAAILFFGWAPTILFLGLSGRDDPDGDEKS